MSRKLLWILLGLVAVVTLAVGSRTNDVKSEDERIYTIGNGVRCPTCAGQSVANSDAAAARSLREQIRQDVQAGLSDDAIRNRLSAGAYGEDILLNPPRTGFAALVWVIPVSVVIVAFGGLALAFRRWEKAGSQGPSRRDRELVAAALGPEDEHGEGSGR